MKKIVSFILLFLTGILYAEVSVQYFGGTEMVSGSCALLKTEETSVIVDCGTFYEETKLPVDNKTIDDQLINAQYFILTHAHVDHSGRLPLLLSKGFNGKIYLTKATKDILLELFSKGWNYNDVEQTYFWSKKQRLRCQKKHQGTTTLHWYKSCLKAISNTETSMNEETLNDLNNRYKINFKLCKKCLKNQLDLLTKQLAVVNYNEEIKLSKNTSFYLIDAGHIPGSASVFIKVKENDLKKILFSGDLGINYSRLLNKKQTAPEADFIFMENTYGATDRNTSYKDYDIFQNEVYKALEQNEIVWIPALSLNRTQKILFELKLAQKKGLINENIPILSLSPTSNDITNLYENEIKHPSAQKWFNPEIYKEGGILPNNYSTKKLKVYPKPSIIISASGMMDKGVSASLMKTLLPQRDVNVFLVSYASPQTPAGKLKRNVKNIGKVHVNATVKSFDIFSDHPDIYDRISWLTSANKYSKIYLVHGEKTNFTSTKNFLNNKGFKNIYEMPLNKKITLQ